MNSIVSAWNIKKTNKLRPPSPLRSSPGPPHSGRPPLHARRSPPRRGSPRPKPAHQRVPAQPPRAAPRRRWGPAHLRRPPLLPHAQQKKAAPPTPSRTDNSRSLPSAGTLAPSARPQQLPPQRSRGSQLPPQTVLQQGRRHAICRISPLRTARRSRERGGDNRSGGGRTGSARSWPESRHCGSCPPPGHGRRRRPAPALEAPTGRFAPPSPSSLAAGLPSARSGDGEGGGRRRRGLGASA